jgi:hypothetical protein
MRVWAVVLGSILDDPVKRATVIERCVAPDGDACERVDRIAKAIPAMMSAGSAGASAASAGTRTAARATGAGRPGGAAGTGDTAAARGASADYRAVCLRAPAELRPCLLPSYELGHATECQAAFAEMVRRPIEITPTTRAEDREDRDDRDDCEDREIAVYVTADGLWVGTGPDARCFEPRHAGALGVAWPEAELRPFAALACR